jgi:hypothetical protein
MKEKYPKEFLLSDEELSIESLVENFSKRYFKKFKKYPTEKQLKGIKIGLKSLKRNEK